MLLFNSSRVSDNVHCYPKISNKLTTVCAHFFDYSSSLVNADPLAVDPDPLDPFHHQLAKIFQTL